MAIAWNPIVVVVWQGVGDINMCSFPFGLVGLNARSDFLVSTLIKCTTTGGLVLLIITCYLQRFLAIVKAMENSVVNFDSQKL